MNQFVNAINSPNLTRTTNGMTALDKTGSKVLDVFFNIGSARNNPNIVSEFMSAYGADKLLTTKCLFWARDVRGGAGERKVFRDVLQTLERTDATTLFKNMHLVPVYGRFDDLLVFTGVCKNMAFSVIRKALMEDQNGLCAKWMPRKGPIANDLRNFLKLSPKAYRKLLVNLSNTVEQKMCAKEFDNINYEQVPSVAASRYQEAFGRNDPKGYGAYKEALKAGTAKINASVVFPHDVTRGLKNGDPDVANAQWKALPNYVGDRKVLPVSDVSGSMCCTASGSVQCMDVSIALGLYLAEKNTGAFKDVICTFHSTPELITVEGDLATKFAQLQQANWGGSTNIQATFELILNLAKKNNSPQEDMPEIVVILSDMQFNQASGDHFNESALDMIKRKYAEAGYKCPGLVFWNLNGEYGNSPSSKEEQGVVMVSGFSPTIMKAVLACDFDKISPEAMMLEVLMSDRYAEVVV
jgi:hypothetical protein